MALTYGFYSSTNGDRKYSADQFGSLFEGIITNGVFMGIGRALEVTAGNKLAETGLYVTVKSGRCWFNHTWLDNTDDYRVSIEPPDSLYDRVDAIVVEVDKTPGVRKSSIIAVKGMPARSPQIPPLYATPEKAQFPLAFVRVTRGVPNIFSYSIVNNRGNSSCPWITGPLKILDSSSITKQWGSEWARWYRDIKSSTDTMKDEMFTDFKRRYDAWVLYMEDRLAGNQAANLQFQIERLKELIGDGTEAERQVFDTIEDGNGLTLMDSVGAPIVGRRIFKLQ